MIVRQVGAFVGVPASNGLRYDVEQRLAPHPGVEFERRIASGREGAARTITWLEREDSWLLDDGRSVPGRGWRDAVLKLARIVEADDDAILVRETGERLLADLGWPEGLFTEVCARGLGA